MIQILKIMKFLARSLTCQCKASLTAKVLFYVHVYYYICLFLLFFIYLNFVYGCSGIHSLFVYGYFIKINIMLICHFSLLKTWFTFSGMGELSFFYVYAIFYLSGFMMSMFFLLCFYLRWELFMVPSNSVQLSSALLSSSSLPIPYLLPFVCYILSPSFSTPSLCSLVHLIALSMLLHLLYLASFLPLSIFVPFYLKLTDRTNVLSL